jgi:hypothetical protein
MIVLLRLTDVFGVLVQVDPTVRTEAAAIRSTEWAGIEGGGDESEDLRGKIDFLLFFAERERKNLFSIDLHAYR